MSAQMYKHVSVGYIKTCHALTLVLGQTKLTPEEDCSLITQSLTESNITFKVHGEVSQFNTSFLVVQNIHDKIAKYQRKTTKYVRGDYRKLKTNMIVYYPASKY